MIVAPGNKRMKVVGFSEIDPGETTQAGAAAIISFEEKSQINLVPLSFMMSCRLVFFLPPRVKYVIGDVRVRFNKLIVVQSDGKFVSSIGKNIIMNNHPLALVHTNYNRSLLVIRETVIIIHLQIICLIRILQLLSFQRPSNTF